jgi:hypothetical protein
MEQYYFYKCIRRTIIQFLDMFNDINIERYHADGTVYGRHKVPVRFGPKSKAYLWIRESGRSEEMLPFISIYVTGIDFDTTRLTNKFQEIAVSDTLTTGTFAKNAMPWNIGFTVNVWTLHMVDVDQIFEQILPYFGPHAFIRIVIPEMNIGFDAKVICNGCSPVMTDDVGEEEARVIKWDITFTVQTYIFKPELHTVALIGSIGGATGTILNNQWTLDTPYITGTVVFNDGVFWHAIANSDGSAATEPGVGENWETYWEMAAGRTSAFGWTSGMGTTGFGDSGTFGKIVNRYYMDLDAFTDRDDPEREIFKDERPSETVAFRIVGVDEEAKIILDYESWGENI